MSNITLAINLSSSKTRYPFVYTQSRLQKCINKTDFPLQQQKIKIHYIKQILIPKTVKRKFITAFSKQNFKQDTNVIKKLTTKTT